MTALVLENLATLPAQVQSLWIFLARLARALDALVSTRAARAVPEWRIAECEPRSTAFVDLFASEMRRLSQFALGREVDILSRT